MEVKIDPDARFFVVGLVLGGMLLAFFCVLIAGMGLRTGYVGLRPVANKFTTSWWGGKSVFTTDATTEETHSTGASAEHDSGH